jgi:glutamine synthetase
MYYTIHEALEYIRDNDVHFVRLAFCDLFGMQKNISIMPEELPAAFEWGVSFDANAIRGFRSQGRSYLMLFPQPDTLTVLPWRPGPGRVVRFYCDIRNPDGSAFAQDSRHLLKRVIDRCERMGYASKIGAECEFYLFKTDEDGDPVVKPLDKGGYLDIAPLDRGENIRREICLCLREMGIMPEASHHEQGPGQNEIDFMFSDALSCADNLVTFKAVVKAMAARNGLHASFMPKPILSAPGSGLHVNLSLSQSDRNIFKNAPGEHSAVAESFIAGILARAPEMTLFLNPLANSYERLGRFEAPSRVSWSHQNRSQLVRIPAAAGAKVRMELRSPDPSANPYFAFALILSAGLDGIERGLVLPPAVNADVREAGDGETAAQDMLPQSLDQAIALAENSAFVKETVGEELLARFLSEEKKEAALYREAEDKTAFYTEHYFPYI